jgi:hypothetical protein
MTYAGLIALGLCFVGWYLTRHRHVPLKTLKRDADDNVIHPAIIVWVCGDCLQVISETHSDQKEAA